MDLVRLLKILVYNAFYLTVVKCVNLCRFVSPKRKAAQDWDWNLTNQKKENQSQV